MANKSIYETSFAAGQTGGEYEAELQGVGDVWSDIENLQVKLLEALRQEESLKVP